MKLIQGAIVFHYEIRSPTHSKDLRITASAIQTSSSGGVVLINLIHEVDLLQYLFGPISLISALETKKTRGYGAEEGAAILMRFESGIVGTFILSDSVPSPWNFEAGTGENPTIPKVENGGGFYRVMGTKGSLSVPDSERWSYDGVVEGKERWVESPPFSL